MLLSGAVGVGELWREVPLQDLRPAVQDDEAGGLGLRLDQLGEGVDERLGGGAGGHRGILGRGGP